MIDTVNRILLATYSSEGTDEFATHTAMRLANSADCELHLIYVERLPGYPVYAPISVRHLEWELHEGAERAGLERLWELDKRIRIAGGTVAGAHLRIGEVAEVVVDLAEQLEVDLIVVARSQEIEDKRKGAPWQGSPPWDTGKTSSVWSGIRWAMERGPRTY